MRNARRTRRQRRGLEARDRAMSTPRTTRTTKGRTKTDRTVQTSRVRRARIPSLKATRSAVTWTRTTGAAAEKRTSGPSTATATVMTATRTTS